MIVGLQVLACLRRKYRLTRILQSCEPASEQHQRRLKELAQKLELKTSVALMRGHVQVPLVTGIVSPKIILRVGQEFDQPTFDQIVLHELAHVKRRDLLWVWLPEVLRMFFFFYPLVYCIQHQAKLCAEMACDELVLSTGSDRRAYATTLLELATTRGVARANPIPGMTA